MRPVAPRSPGTGQRLIVVASALAGAVMLFELLAGRGREDLGTGEREQHRGYYMEDATLTDMGPDGDPRMVVHAANIEQQLDDDSVVLHDLRLDYVTGKAGSWRVTAESGRMPPDRSSLLLSGDVTVTGSEDQGSPVIVTDRLTYDTNADYVQTPEFVTIRFGKHVLGGRGLRANLNTGTLRLESNVNGRFTP
jgi:LPS export ABC transporter protein LptC